MSNPKMSRKVAVFFNYFCVVIILIIFYGVKYLGFPKVYLLFEIIPFIGLIISFKIAFGTSNLWKLTHTSVSKLDEREMQIIYKAITYSYSIFTVLCIAIIYIINILGLAMIDVVAAACLFYIAHILPASIIVWNEKPAII